MSDTSCTTIKSITVQSTYPLGGGTESFAVELRSIVSGHIYEECVTIEGYDGDVTIWRHDIPALIAALQEVTSG